MKFYYTVITELYLKTQKLRYIDLYLRIYTKNMILYIRARAYAHIYVYIA